MRPEFSADCSAQLFRAGTVLGPLQFGDGGLLQLDDSGGGLLPLFGKCGVFGSLEGWREIHSGPCGALTPVAGKAIGLDEGRDAVTKVLLGIGFEDVVIPSQQAARTGQGQDQPEAPCRCFQKTTDRGGNGHERGHVLAKFITRLGCAGSSNRVLGGHAARGVSRATREQTPHPGALIPNIGRYSKNNPITPEP